VNTALIVPARNAEKDLPDFLASLEANLQSSWYVYFIDDASTDETGLQLEEWCRQHRRGEVIRRNRRSGPPAARNAALAVCLEADFDLIVLHDSDCVLEANTIVAHQRAHKLKQTAGIIGGPVRSIHKTPIGRADGYASWFTSPPGKASGFVRNLHLPTCNLSIKPWVFHRIGLFREDLATGEDVAFCSEAHRAGIPIYFESRAICGHKDRDLLEDALLHHRRWGEHTHAVRRNSRAFLSGFVPNNPFLCRILAIPYALSFTFLVMGLWFPYDPRVIWDSYRIYRMKRAFTGGMVTGALRRKTHPDS
jgi:glycosyltransferase involved in cell wall biosynthesis